MGVLIIVSMEDLNGKDGLLRDRLIHVFFCAPYVDDHCYMIGSLALLYVSVCRDRRDVSGMVDIPRVDYVGEYVFQMVIYCFLSESSSKAPS